MTDKEKSKSEVSTEKRSTEISREKLDTNTIMEMPIVTSMVAGAESTDKVFTHPTPAQTGRYYENVFEEKNVA